MVQIKLTTLIYYYVLLFILSILNVVLESGAIQNGIFALEMGMSLALMYYVYSDPKFLNSKIIFTTLIIAIFAVFHFIQNPKSDVVFLIKILFPFIFYMAGLKMGSRPIYVPENVRNISLFVICLLPLLFRVFQIISGYKVDTNFVFFVNSNNYAYYVFVAAVYLLLFSNLDIKVIIFFVVAFLLSKTLGAILAIGAGVALFFRTKLLQTRTIILFLGSMCLLYIAINFLNIYAFQRIQNSLSIFTTLSDQFSLTTLDQVDYVYALGYAKATEDLSFLFRIKQWTEILKLFFKSDTISFLFGHGLNTIPEVTTSGLVAHNDYLAILYELGILLFSMIVYFYFSALKKIKKIYPFIFFVAIAVFHFTENLYNNFLITQLYLFLMGVHTSQMKVNEEMTKELIYEDSVSQ